MELTTELRQASKEVEEEAAEAREQYYFDHPEYAEGGTPDAFYFQVLATESAISTAVAPHLAEFEEQARKQETMISRLQYLSPAILAQRALAGIAGTAQRWYDDFNGQVLAFHGVWQGFFSERILGSIPMNAASYGRYSRIRLPVTGKPLHGDPNHRPPGRAGGVFSAADGARDSLSGALPSGLTTAW